MVVLEAVAAGLLLDGIHALAIPGTASWFKLQVPPGLLVFGGLVLAVLPITFLLSGVPLQGPPGHLGYRRRTMTPGLLHLPHDGLQFVASWDRLDEMVGGEPEISVQGPKCTKDSCDLLERKKKWLFSRVVDFRFDCPECKSVYRNRKSGDALRREVLARARNAIENASTARA